MGDEHSAQIVYGYDLGYAEDHKIKEVDEYKSINASWVKRDEDGWADESLSEALTRKLYEAIPGADPQLTESYDQEDVVEAHYGVKVLEHGWLVEGDTPSYALIAYKVECDGGDAKPVDLRGLLATPGQLSLDQKLSRALGVLEVTPNQEKPAWLLLASR